MGRFRREIVFDFIMRVEMCRFFLSLSLSSESCWVNVCYDVISLSLLLLLFIRLSLFLVCGKFLINVTIVHNTVSLIVNVIESICARVC